MLILNDAEIRTNDDCAFILFDSRFYYCEVYDEDVGGPEEYLVHYTYIKSIDEQSLKKLELYSKVSVDKEYRYLEIPLKFFYLKNANNK
jgi:hypothetical protein